jgi:hypothetical protein
MSEVKRWTPTNTGEMVDTVEFDEAPDVLAEYVLSTDFDRALARIAELETMLTGERLLRQAALDAKEIFACERDALQQRLGEAERGLRLDELVRGARLLLSGDCPLSELNCDDWLRRAEAALSPAPQSTAEPVRAKGEG